MIDFRCGDFLEVMKKGGFDDDIDIIITDPPYNLDDKTMTKIHEFGMDKARRGMIVFCKPENQWPIKADQYCFWAKPISTKNTSKSYSRFVEMIMIYEGKDYFWDSNRHWSNYVNIFNDRLVLERCHRCQKPKSLMKKLILNHTKEGDTILDPFAGSCTTLIEAHKNERNAIGFEKDEGVIVQANKRIDNEVH